MMRSSSRKRIAGLVVALAVLVQTGPVRTEAATPATPGTQVTLTGGPTPVDAVGNTSLDRGHHDIAVAETGYERRMADDLLAQWNQERTARGLQPLGWSDNLSRENRAWLFQERIGGVDHNRSEPDGSGSLPPYPTPAYRAETSSVALAGDLATMGLNAAGTGYLMFGWLSSLTFESTLVAPGTVAGVAIACLPDGSMGALVSIGWRSASDAAGGDGRPSGWSDPTPGRPIADHYGKGLVCTSTPLPPSAPGPLGYLDTSAGVGRLADTRLTKGRLPAGGVLTVPVAPDAIAAALQVTAVSMAAPGFLTVYPCGGPRPNASVVNVNAAGGDSSASMIATLDPTGATCVYTSQAADIVVDRTAVFLPAATHAAGRYVPIQTPNRTLDTRLVGRPGPTGSVSLGVPSGATAAVINVTVTGSTLPGWVALFRGGDAWPGNSSVNFTAGETRANMVIVPVDAAGRVTFRSSVPTDVILDLVGSFTDASAPDVDTGLYQPEKPSRIIDTRPSSNIGSHGTLAATGFVLYNTGRVVTAVAATVTAVAAVLGYWSVYSSQVPATSSLNVNAPGATPNLTITASGGAVIYSQSGGDVLVDVTGVFV